ncbi:EAL domain-containing protein [Pseudomonas helleri]|uniref:EAL domain-containing protein n=1 Tax=Pseudomonas helleri TaxID=1608996 RepID=UPI00382BC485
MNTLNVVIFCASPVKTKALTGLLKTIGIINIHAPEKDSEPNSFTPPFVELDVVICDSFNSLKELSYLRNLCEYFSFFSVIESEKLEKPMKWGASNLVAHYKKHHLGRYEDDISKVKIHSLLKKALTLKDIAKNNVFKSGVEQETLKQILHKNMDFKDPFHDVQADRVTAYFQPQYCALTKTITGIEVIAHWSHPAYDRLSTTHFKHDTPEHIVHWVLFSCALSNAIQLHRHTLNIDPTIIYTYIIDASLLKSRHFASNVLEALKIFDIPLHTIALEISGKVDTPMSLECIDNITTLMNCQVGLSLGNFGASDSPFDILADMPFTQIKLNTNFALTNSSIKKNQIISSIISMAKSLHLKVIANEVETQKQFAQLQHLGVDAAQGNFFHPPMTGEKLLTLLLDNTTTY